jgi:hypothetical protein
LLIILANFIKPATSATGQEQVYSGGAGEAASPSVSCRNRCNAEDTPRSQVVSVSRAQPPKLDPSRMVPGDRLRSNCQDNERMPVLLTREEEFETWLKGSPDEAFALMREYPAEKMRLVQEGFDKEDLLRAASLQGRQW